MIITDIKQQRKDPRRYSVFINEEFAFGLSGVDVLYYKLKIDDELTQERYDYILDEVVLTKAKDKAYRYVGYKMRSEEEVRRKLADEYHEHIIDKVIDILFDYEYLDDKKYALAFIKDQVNFKKDGKNNIRYSLYKRGVPDKIINQAIDEFDFDEPATIMELLKKRLRYKDISTIDRKERQKQFNYLRQKGFDFDDINNCLDDIINLD